MFHGEALSVQYFGVIGKSVIIGLILWMIKFFMLQNFLFFEAVRNSACLVISKVLAFQIATGRKSS